MSEPTPELIAAGVRALIAGRNARHPERRWHVGSPPHRLEGTALVGTGKLKDGFATPDDQDAILDRSATATANEYRLHESTEEVA